MNVPPAPRPCILNDPSASRASSLKVPRDHSVRAAPGVKLPIPAQTRRYAGVPPNCGKANGCMAARRPDERPHDERQRGDPTFCGVDVLA
jgi:hypothetical protein